MITFSVPNPYRNPPPRLPYTALPIEDERPATTFRGEVVLYKGFYDLLALIRRHHLSIPLGGDG